MRSVELACDAGDGVEYTAPRLTLFVVLGQVARPSGRLNPLGERGLVGLPYLHARAFLQASQPVFGPHDQPLHLVPERIVEGKQIAQDRKQDCERHETLLPVDDLETLRGLAMRYDDWAEKYSSRFFLLGRSGLPRTIAELMSS